MKNSLAKIVWEGQSHWFSSASLSFDKSLIAQALTNIFAVGPYHYFVIDFVNPEVLDLYCSNTTDFLNADSTLLSVDFIMRKIHPDDISYVKLCEQHVIHFIAQQTDVQNILNYKFSYQFRFKYKGEYRLLLHQCIILSVDGFGRVSKALNIHTIIDHISTTNNKKLSFIGLNGTPSFQSIDVLEKKVGCPLHKASHFSSREISLIRCFAEGMTSKQAADFLGISEHTVRTHRKNILNKTDRPNMTAVAIQCVREGLI